MKIKVIVEPETGILRRADGKRLSLGDIFSLDGTTYTITVTFERCAGTNTCAKDILDFLTSSKPYPFPNPYWLASNMKYAHEWIDLLACG